MLPRFQSVQSRYDAHSEIVVSAIYSTAALKTAPASASTGIARICRSVESPAGAARVAVLRIATAIRWDVSLVHLRFASQCETLFFTSLFV